MRWWDKHGYEGGGGKGEDTGMTDRRRRVTVGSKRTPKKELTKNKLEKNTKKAKVLPVRDLMTWFSLSLHEKKQYWGIFIFRGSRGSCGVGPCGYTNLTAWLFRRPSRHFHVLKVQTAKQTNWLRPPGSEGRGGNWGLAPGFVSITAGESWVSNWQKLRFRVLSGKQSEIMWKITIAVGFSPQITAGQMLIDNNCQVIKRLIINTSTTLTLKRSIENGVQYSKGHNSHGCSDLWSLAFYSKQLVPWVQVNIFGKRVWVLLRRS